MQPPDHNWLVMREPLPPPAINPKLEEFSALPRSVECLRHFVLTIEFWISPSGRLRWWLKVNFQLAAFLFIPAIVLMPVVNLVLHEVDGWLSLLVGIAWKLIVLDVLVFVILKHFPSSSRGSSRRRK